MELHCQIISAKKPTGVSISWRGFWTTQFPCRVQITGPAYALVGLIPGNGDGIGAALSSYIFIVAARMGVPNKVLLRMGYNIAVESIIGLIPLVGDTFDMV